MNEPAEPTWVVTQKTLFGLEGGVVTIDRQAWDGTRVFVEPEGWRWKAWIEFSGLTIAGVAPSEERAKELGEASLKQLHKLMKIRSGVLPEQEPDPREHPIPKDKP